MSVPISESTKKEVRISQEYIQVMAEDKRFGFSGNKDESHGIVGFFPLEDLDFNKSYSPVDGRASAIAEHLPPRDFIDAEGMRTEDTKARIKRIGSHSKVLFITDPFSEWGGEVRICGEEQSHQIKTMHGTQDGLFDAMVAGAFNGEFDGYYGDYVKTYVDGGATHTGNESPKAVAAYLSNLVDRAQNASTQFDIFAVSEGFGIPGTCLVCAPHPAARVNVAGSKGDISLIAQNDLGQEVVGVGFRPTPANGRIWEYLQAKEIDLSSIYGKVYGDVSTMLQQFMGTEALEKKLRDDIGGSISAEDIKSSKVGVYNEMYKNLIETFNQTPLLHPGWPRAPTSSFARFLNDKESDLVYGQPLF